MTSPSRRSVLAGGLSAVLLAACTRGAVPSEPVHPPSDPAEPLPGISPTQSHPPVDQRIGALEKRHNAVVGVYAVDLVSGRDVAYRAGDPFAVCSTFKTYAAACVLRKAGRGEFALSDPVRIAPADIVSHSPVTGAYAGRTLTLAELCQAALQQSDNTAANCLLRVIGGPQAITEFARSIGDERTRLDRWETTLNSAIPGDPRDTSTPEALGGGYRRLLEGDVLAPGQRQQLDDWMRGNQTSSLRAGLPQGWTSADKTGGGDYGSTNDVGIAYGPAGQRVLLAVMTRSRTDDPAAPGLRPLIGELTTLIVPELQRA